MRDLRRGKKQLSSCCTGMVVDKVRQISIAAALVFLFRVDRIVRLHLLRGRFVVSQCQGPRSRSRRALSERRPIVLCRLDGNGAEFKNRAASAIVAAHMELV